MPQHLSLWERSAAREARARSGEASRREARARSGEASRREARARSGEASREARRVRVTGCVLCGTLTRRANGAPPSPRGRGKYALIGAEITKVSRPLISV